MGFVFSCLSGGDFGKGDWFAGRPYFRFLRCANGTPNREIITSQVFAFLALLSWRIPHA
jgi:hypothetical protein